MYILVQMILLFGGLFLIFNPLFNGALVMGAVAVALFLWTFLSSRG